MGAAVVLQPMISPRYAGQVRSGEPVFVEQRRAERVYSGIRAYPDRRVVLTTTKGEIELRLEPEAAPNTSSPCLTRGWRRKSTRAPPS